MESSSRQVYKKSHGSYRDNDLQGKENVFDGFFGLQSVLALLKVLGKKVKKRMLPTGGLMILYTMVKSVKQHLKHINRRF